MYEDLSVEFEELTEMSKQVESELVCVCALLRSLRSNTHCCVLLWTSLRIEI